MAGRYRKQGFSYRFLSGLVRLASSHAWHDGDNACNPILKAYLSHYERKDRLPISIVLEEDDRGYYNSYFVFKAK